MGSLSCTSNFEWVVGIVGLSTMHSYLIHKMEHPIILVEVSLLHRQSNKNPKECCDEVFSTRIDGVVICGTCTSLKITLCLGRMHIYVPSLGMANLQLCNVTSRKWWWKHCQMVNIHNVWALHAVFPFGCSVSMLCKVDTLHACKQWHLIQVQYHISIHIMQSLCTLDSFAFLVQCLIYLIFLEVPKCLTPMAPSSKFHIL